MLIQSTGFSFLCLSLAFSATLLKYFWYFGLCDLPLRFSAPASWLMALWWCRFLIPHCILCLSTGVTTSQRSLRPAHKPQFAPGGITAREKGRARPRLLNLTFFCLANGRSCCPNAKASARGCYKHCAEKRN